MRIRWTPRAVNQLASSVKHIEENNPDAASAVARNIIDCIDQLATFPALGRPGHVEGTRELVVPPFVIVYRVREETVQILHVWHGAQDWR
jgi:toxin ParE1/3/4